MSEKITPPTERKTSLVSGSRKVNSASVTLNNNNNNTFKRKSLGLSLTSKAQTLSSSTPGPQLSTANMLKFYSSCPAVLCAQKEGSVVKVGFLMKRGGGHKSSSFKRRFCVLTSTHQRLFYFKSEKEKKYQGSIDRLKSYTVEGTNDPERNYCFCLTPEKKTERTYIFAAETEESQFEWIKYLAKYAQSSLSEEDKKLDFSTSKMLETLKLSSNGLEIPPEQIEWSEKTQEFLGKGASGIVRKGTWLKTTVAIKALNNLPEFTDDEEIRSFYQEIGTLAPLRHPNIVSMYGFSRKEGYLCLITEYVQGGSLANYMKNSGLSLHSKLNILASVARGMLFLHQRGVIHRDLKPANILVEADFKIKICDFGLSGFSKKDEENEKGFGGSPGYAAPELPSPQHSFPVDVYSFAVVMWELLGEQELWPTKQTVYQITQAVLNGERPPLLSTDKAPPPMMSLIQKSWDPEPQARPDFQKIVDEILLFVSNIGKEKENANPLDSLREVFDNQPTCSWNDFAKVIFETFQLSSTSYYQPIQPFITSPSQPDMVSREMFETFFLWFTPITAYPIYQQEEDPYNPSSLPTDIDTDQITFDYTLVDVITVAKIPGFVGFVDSNGAFNLLIKEPPGTYLLRFSKEQRFYTLSLNYGQIGHWRITTRIKKGRIVYKLDENDYDSLIEIIQKHKQTPLSLKKGVSETLLVHPVSSANVTQNLDMVHNIAKTEFAPEKNRGYIVL